MRPKAEWAIDSELIRARGIIVKYSPPSERMMCEVSVFPIFLESDLLEVDKILELTFLRQEKTWKDSKRHFSINCSWVLCSMDCLQLPFIRVEEAVSWTQRFLTRKIWPKNEVYLWQTNLKANVCRNSTFQVNRKKNATGRRLTSSNRAAIFVSTSCEERHNKPFWL